MRKLDLTTVLALLQAISTEIEAGKLGLKALDFSLRAELDDTRRASEDLAGDAVRLRQVLSNLVENAVEFTAHGEVSARVVKSELGQGRTFTLTARFPQKTELQETTPLSILIAEDNAFSAQLIRQLLQRRGHRVTLASNGVDALALATRGSYELMLLDLHMPGLDGFGVIERIRARERSTGGHLPVVALTAQSRPEDRERCLASGMDEFLGKPVHEGALWAAVERVTPLLVRAERAWPPLVDAQVLLAACGADANILAQIGIALRGHLPSELQRAADGLRASDAGALREAAHRIYGMVSAISSQAGSVASELEDQAALGQLNEAAPLLDRLALMSEELLAVIAGLSIDELRARIESSPVEVSQK